ncbi:MAG: hypothetical protein H6513_09550 [Acidimicrobiaceae bacterium]|nr:hypothetical protein [Acidimicrobiaceae bacterium]
MRREADREVLIDSMSGLGGTAQCFVETAERHGFRVHASSADRFRIARVNRPTWATIAGWVMVPLLGVGFIFLAMKRTISGDATIVELRTGVKLRLTGQLPDEFVATLRDALTSSPPGDTMPTRSAFQVVDETQMVPGRVRNVTSPAHSAGGGGLESPVHSMPSDPLAMMPPSAGRSVPAPSLRTIDGRILVAARNGVVGRDPVPQPSRPAAIHPIADASLSKTHFTFGVSSDGVWVVDEHSTNGTAIDVGGRVMRCTPGVAHEVPIGGRVFAGDVVFMVEAG